MDALAQAAVATPFTFQQWMRQMDHAVMAESGLSLRDLTLCPFRHWYDDGLSPKDAAIEALKDDGFFDEYDELADLIAFAQAWGSYF